MSIKTDEIGDIKVNLKSIMHEEKHNTVPSGIGLVNVQTQNQESEYYVVQASRISDLLLHKLEFERELKRIKTSEDEFDVLDLSEVTMPKLHVVDRLHINGPIEDTIIHTNDLEHANKLKSDQTLSHHKHDFFDPLAQKTLIFTSGSLNFLKTHLNSHSSGSLDLENVDKMYSL